MTVRFDEAFRRFLEVVRTADEIRTAGNVLVVRDLAGRLRLAMQRRPSASLAGLEQRLKEVSGAFFAGQSVIGEEMLAPGLVFESPDTYQVDGVSVLERLALGAEWTRAPLLNLGPTPPRATLYGIKGGVGRSTALCAWARHLAQGGERVLVIDLDLESPGVSTTLLPPDSAPDFGVVDWLVEDAVENAASELVESMVARSPLAEGTAGDILVAPCGDHTGEHYLSKLARAYLDVPREEGGVRSFAERLAVMIDSLEAKLNPTVVLLDSRAGLHDLAGIATTRLSAMTFLFAIGSRQTWSGYRVLLNSWMHRPSVGREVRDRLRVVAACVPETGREEYLDRFTTSSYDLFADSLYEEVGPDSLDAFNFDIHANDAPHAPLPIYWSRAFQDWDPLATEVTDDQVRAAFGQFLDAATELVINSPSVEQEILE